VEELDDALEELAADELEELEEQVVDPATAARTAEELRHEIAVVADLVDLARSARRSGTDRRWIELRDLLLSREVHDETTGVPRKIIVFTEHVHLDLPGGSGQRRRRGDQRAGQLQAEAAGAQLHHDRNSS
jgi:hypothetical protein